MSAYFNFDDTGTSGFNRQPKSVYDDGRWHVEDVLADGKASIRLMFAELPAYTTYSPKPITDGGAIRDARRADSVLDYGRFNDEVIGFNHQIAKRWVAHVAFTDGHVDSIIKPKNAKTFEDSDIKKLTQQLCKAIEIEGDLREKMK